MSSRYDKKCSFRIGFPKESFGSLASLLASATSKEQADSAGFCTVAAWLGLAVRASGGQGDLRTQVGPNDAKRSVDEEDVTATPHEADVIPRRTSQGKKAQTLSQKPFHLWGPVSLSSSLDNPVCQVCKIHPEQAPVHRIPCTDWTPLRFKFL